MKNDSGVDVVRFVMEDGEEIDYISDAVIPVDIDIREVVDIEY
jgi:hypothetical protein